MPSKKKKFNARFPPARIKKIMQLDEDVGKVASAVPVMISRALEIFMENLLVQSSQLAGSKGARTLTSSHLKQIIQADPKLGFLHELVSKIPDATSINNNADSSSSDGRRSTSSGPSVTNGHPVKEQLDPNANPSSSSSSSVIASSSFSSSSGANRKRKKRGRPPKKSKEGNFHREISNPSDDNCFDDDDDDDDEEDDLLADVGHDRFVGLSPIQATGMPSQLPPPFSTANASTSSTSTGRPRGVTFQLPTS